MKYIYEGPDGTGKSTFAETYCSHNKGYIYIHNKQKPINKVDNMFLLKNEQRIIEQRRDEIVIDRSYIISEYVYSRVMNRKVYITDEDLSKFLNLIKDNNVVLYFFLFKELPKQKEDDKELPIKEIKEKYEEIIKICIYLNIKTSVMYIEDAKGVK